MNKNIALNIQVLQYKEIENKYYFIISGWGFSKKGHALKYKVKINGKEENIECKSINRGDVQDTYKEYVKISNIGFSISVECDSKPKSFELFAYDGEDQMRIHLSDSQIQKFLVKEGISYSIDAIEYNTYKQEYTCAFWAFDTEKNELAIEIQDSKGNVVPTQIEQSVRMDLLVLDLVDKDTKTCGYKVSFKGSPEEKYVLLLKSRNEEIKLKLNKKLKFSNLTYKRLWIFEKRAMNYFRINGLKKTIARIFGNKNNTLDYEKWFNATKVKEEELREQRSTHFEYEPKISIIVATFNTKESYLKEMIDSVVDQSYSNWELCIGDGSTNDSVETYVKKHYGSDSRILFNKLEKNYGISGNMNGALELATGDYVGLFDHDDILTPDCLFEVVSSLQEIRHDAVYTDEDKLDDEHQIFVDPHFKPDFAPQQLCSHNYITHFFVVKMDIIKKVGAMREEYDGSQDYDFIFRCTEVANSVHHIPKVLYHWRMHIASTAANPESKMYCYTAGKKAIESHYERLGLKAKVEMLPLPYYGMYHTTFETPGNPLVSIIIPNKDLKDTLQTCIESLEHVNTYKNIEIIIVENNSETEEIFEYYKELEKTYNNVRIVTWKDRFNYSLINNFGVQHAKGDYLLFLNNDTEMIKPDSISHMLGYCMLDEVGCIGAKLLYPDETVQHCGVVVGFRGYALHAFTGIGKNDPGYMGRALVTSNYSAVTAACLMVKKSDFNSVEGFDPQFEVACNDVDFCLKVQALGKYNVEDVSSVWTHYESKTRGLDISGESLARLQNEISKFQTKWSDLLEKGDPFYNKNYNTDEIPFTYPHA